MKSGKFWAWVVFGLGAAYFFIPLIGTLEFSLRMRRGVYSLDAYRVVLGDPRFQATFGYSVVVAIFTIVLGVLIVVPTAYWIRLRMPHLRPMVEFITLLPLVIPAIVIVFGYIRMYGSDSPLPFLASARGTDAQRHPVAQFDRRLAAEGQHQDAFGVAAPGDPVRDRLDEGGRLAGAGTGEDEQRPGPVVNHGALGGVQTRGVPAFRRGTDQSVGATAPPSRLGVRRLSGGGRGAHVVRRSWWVCWWAVRPEGAAVARG